MRTRQMLRVRLVLALVGLAVGQIAVWAPISVSEVNFLVILVALAQVGPYPIYVLLTRTRAMSALGGVALLALPVIAYGDTYFGGPMGVSFAFVTVPIMNMLAVLGIILVDQLLLRYTTMPREPVNKRPATHQGPATR